jgi:hypothetical protein
MACSTCCGESESPAPLLPSLLTPFLSLRSLQMAVGKNKRLVKNRKGGKKKM